MSPPVSVPRKPPSHAGRPVEAQARLEVVRVGLRDRGQTEDRVVAVCLKDALVQLDQALDVVPRQLIPQPEAQRQGRLHAPFVLDVVILVPPAVVVHFFSAGQRLVDGRRPRDVVDEVVQRRIDEPAPYRREEEALHVLAPHVGSHFEHVIAPQVRKVVLELVGIVVAELRQVDREADRRAADGRIESGHPELGDLDRGDLFRCGVLCVGNRSEVRPRAAELVRHVLPDDAVQPHVQRVLVRRDHASSGPPGVTWPLPEFLGVCPRRYRPVSAWFDENW